MSPFSLCFVNNSVDSIVLHFVHWHLLQSLCKAYSLLVRLLVFFSHNLVEMLPRLEKLLVLMKLHATDRITQLSMLTRDLIQVLILCVGQLVFVLVDVFEVFITVVA